jgi:hypothetical protein
MEELLVFIIQFIAEIFIDVMASLPSWPSKKRANPESERVIVFSLLWLFAGGCLGWLSVLALPTLILSNPSFRLANLVIAPLISAAVGFYLAQRRAQANPNIVPWHHIWYSFFFTLAFVGVRFAYTVAT